MKQGASLQLKLGQKLKLAPQLRQAIALLQLNRIELRQTIREALDTNPMLERSEEAPGDSDEQTEEFDGDLEVDYGDDYGFDDLPEGYSVTSGPAPNYDEFISDRADESLQQHLLWQVNLAGFSETDEAIARAIIYALDEEGYLQDDLSTLRASLAPEYLVSTEEVAAVLERVQHFEPIGVASRSVGESLLVQLKAMPSSTPALGLACHLVERHLEELGKQDIRAMVRATGMGESEIQAALAVIRRCNPHPCSRFGRDDENYIVPDVYIHPSEEGWRVTLNPDNDPGLQLNGMYMKLAKQARGEDKKYLRNRLQEARWLISGLEMRNQTLQAVTRAIVERQHEFFSMGESGLKPLLQREVAESIGVHESTVSRATTEKYAHTPRGVFELKFFFSVGIDTQDGQQIAATAVKARVRRLITEEPPGEPLSDQALAERLAEGGIKLARRTVAKYREQLGIPGSAQRRRAARLQTG
ncbi:MULTISPECIES: RNA polymerase factor sigma-54 [unclassified Wenzhouxiangella]|uniref:RNA polymerase factor sigma-54 n=1 Tax=unclassified Wenzhouxiangella TaxID=2613841 RepID=UPI000E325A0F|nr:MULTISPECIES: RNA polymerase factor sigma-54 [unclassified Wenzhouxiangella]RFF28153.1 RNA polymerase factor sigma-54 [Wenzhouxiangella sp. 15181]RFP67980.1 RNA polymerase factor sigma-54 [Wenzhouxiangella sp. 15190]